MNSSCPSFPNVQPIPFTQLARPSRQAFRMFTKCSALQFLDMGAHERKHSTLVREFLIVAVNALLDLGERSRVESELCAHVLVDRLEGGEESSCWERSPTSGRASFV